MNAVEDRDLIELPDNWQAPEGTLEPLLKEDNPPWFRIMNFVCLALEGEGNDPSVLIAYRDQAMAGDFGHLVRVSMAFMGEIELEHDSPTFL